MIHANHFEIVDQTGAPTHKERKAVTRQAAPALPAPASSARKQDQDAKLTSNPAYAAPRASGDPGGDAGTVVSVPQDSEYNFPVRLREMGAAGAAASGLDVLNSLHAEKQRSGGRGLLAGLTGGRAKPQSTAYHSQGSIV